jgi:lipoprotein-anchoring transpeptidase ErfK/SrfK
LSSNQLRTLVFAVVAALAVAAGGCGSQESDDANRTAATAPNDDPGVDSTRPAKPVKPDHDGIPLQTPHDAYPVVWVRVHEQARLRTEPGGDLVDTVHRHTQWGSISAFGVVRQTAKWAGVTTPLLPNGELAWVRLRSDRLRGGWTKMSVVVDVSDRRGVLLRAGDPALTFPVTVGMPGADTPTGRFAVTDTFRGDINPAYGCCAVALSATQPHLPSGWLGGRRIAIHGTYGTLGVAASHGCVRASDDVVSKLVDRVPLGAPVFIRA